MITKTYTMREEVVQKLEKVKKTHGVPMAWLVNQAIEEYIDNHHLID